MKGSRMLTMALMMGALSAVQRSYRHEYAPPQEPTERDRARLAKANGLQEFNIGGNTIWALNRKSAERKYQKMKKRDG